MPWNAPLWRTFLGFLLPMMLSNILQSLSGTINTIFVGQMIGVRALAAATVFFPLMFFSISFIIGLSNGGAVLIGQAWGARDLDRVKAVAGTVLSVTLLSGLVVSLIGGIYARQILVLFATPPDILDAATEYARVSLIASPALFVFLLETSILRGVGDVVTPLLVLVLATLAGLIFTPVFLGGWGGLPAHGVVGAAYATIASFLVALAYLFVRLARRDHPLALNRALLRHMGFNWPIIRLVLRLGIPTALQMVSMAMAEMALLGMANHYGAGATAAYGAVNQVIAYVQFPAISIAITASILGAQAIGAGHSDRLNAITRTGLLLNLIITSGLVVITYALSDSIIRLFIIDPEVIALTGNLLDIVLWSAVIYGAAGVFSAVMRASGTVMIPTVLTILAIVAVEVPVAWIMSGQLGVTGVWIAYPVAFTAMLVFQASYYLLVWRKVEIVSLV